MAPLVLHNGIIHTLDKGRPTVNSLVISNGVVTYIGNDISTNLREYSDAQIIDLSGRTILPGLRDAHAHMKSFGKTDLQANLTEAQSLEQVAEIIREYAQKASKGDWILGRGWNHERWNDRSLPTHEFVSRLGRGRDRRCGAVSKGARSRQFAAAARCQRHVVVGVPEDGLQRAGIRHRHRGGLEVGLGHAFAIPANEFLVLVGRRLDGYALSIVVGAVHVRHGSARAGRHGQRRQGAQAGLEGIVGILEKAPVKPLRGRGRDAA